MNGLVRALRWLAGIKEPIGIEDYLIAIEAAIDAFPAAVSAELKAETEETLRTELNALISSGEDIGLGVRLKLAEALFAHARFGCMMIKEDGSRDLFGLHGKIGITGALASRQLELIRRDEILAGLFGAVERPSQVFFDPEEADAHIVMCALRTWVWAVFWNRLRMAMESAGDPDWFAEVREALYAYNEDYLRRLIGMDSVLERDHPFGSDAPKHYEVLVELMRRGLDDPVAVWRAAPQQLGYGTGR